MAKRIDVTVPRDGAFGMFMFTPRTKRAQEFVRDNVALESWQWLGGTFVVEDYRMAWDLAQGMVAEGLRVV